MKKTINIDGIEIGEGYPPYIIAELSANHNGDINRAFKILEAAKNAGANAVKLQSYTHETITIESDSKDFLITEGLWKGQTLYDLYKAAHMPWDWHRPLFEKAGELGISIFSSPFDFSAVDLLEELGAPAYKVASFEVVDLPLISYIAKTGKPIIISTGMANEREIEEAVNTARESGAGEIVVLQCVSGYPAPADQYNLKTIPDIAERFNVLAGLSDHTLTNSTAIAAVALGASVIEKHVTLDRDGGGVDDSFSLEPKQLKSLCLDANEAWHALGRVNYKKTDSEKDNAKFRRSLYVVEDVAVGEVMTNENVRSIRPGYGVAPKYLDQVLGKKALVALKKGTPVDFKYLDS